MREEKKDCIDALMFFVSAMGWMVVVIFWEGIATASKNGNEVGSAIHVFSSMEIGEELRDGDLRGTHPPEMANGYS